MDKYSVEVKPSAQKEHNSETQPSIDVPCRKEPNRWKSTFSPDVQDKLIDSAAKQGRDADQLVQEVLTQYLADEARFAVTVESWTDEEHRAAISHIEEGFLQAERGELIDGDQAHREIDLMKHHWRLQRSSAQ